MLLAVNGGLSTPRKKPSSFTIETRAEALSDKAFYLDAQLCRRGDSDAQTQRSPGTARAGTQNSSAPSEAHLDFFGMGRSERPMGTGMAERVRFELTEPFGSAVFKTAALNRSATSPFLE